MLIKLHKKTNHGLYYWETWGREEGPYLIHWGRLGDKGQRKTLPASRTAKAKLEAEIQKAKAEGYREIGREGYHTLLIEYIVVGFETAADLDKRHHLEERMNETLGWTGLGYCDGGSIGSGAMEVCCLVVDFELAKAVIEGDLSNTEFSDYARIYQS